MSKHASKMPHCCWAIILCTIEEKWCQLKTQCFLGMLGILFINSVKAPSKLYLDFCPNDSAHIKIKWNKLVKVFSKLLLKIQLLESLFNSEFSLLLGVLVKWYFLSISISEMKIIGDGLLLTVYRKPTLESCFQNVAKHSYFNNSFKPLFQALYVTLLC